MIFIISKQLLFVCLFVGVGGCFRGMAACMLANTHVGCPPRSPWRLACLDKLCWVAQSLSRQVGDRCTPTLELCLICSFLSEGHYKTLKDNIMFFQITDKCQFQDIKKFLYAKKSLKQAFVLGPFFPSMLR